MKVQEVIKSQYQAALEMLRRAVVKCPESLWDDPTYKNRFWHLAYHALFYTHLYLHPSQKAFVPWEKQRDDYQFMGPTPWPPHTEPEIGEPYTKEEILEYLDLCRQHVEEIVDTLDLDGESGFDWLPFGKMELQFYNIRHLQHHAGELCERLGTAVKINVDWVGIKK